MTASVRYLIGVNCIIAHELPNSIKVGVGKFLITSSDGTNPVRMQGKFFEQNST